MTPESLPIVEQKDVAQLVAVLEEQTRDINSQIKEKGLMLEQVELCGWPGRRD